MINLSIHNVVSVNVKRDEKRDLPNGCPDHDMIKIVIKTDKGSFTVDLFAKDVNSLQAIKEA